ncbi:isocitrate lyase/PEP mutase family protein [Hoeflea sp. YIM 152468]|uniref:isocitrate lyase/PEP mutase family protein n=1 Tax=Hoeflea sp. YIM 152468 TaxID=3031759 RepID=UPI0023DC4EDC|nr:isocitrate lyase/PEP mutase family protein [Hoeflea sp. YIM 152468]MDF1609075.1 isocitrate lyase/PEP mutase family protein [Hoeflea sp. YIM 152468]
MEQSAGRRLREMVEARRALLVPGVMNALAARVAEDVGFEALYITGAGVTNAHLGLPDVGLISPTQMSDTIGVIRNITELPLIVDGDTGFGNAINVWHTVRSFERAGANAIQIEDQVFPKRCGHFEGKGVIPGAEMAEKIRAAVEARKSGDFLVIARTDAYATHGLDEAMRRAELFIEAGADITFVEAPRQIDEIRRVVETLPVPQLVNMVIGGQTPSVGLSDFRELGVGLVLYANASLQGAIKGMHDALTHLRTQGALTENDGLVASFAERQRMVGMADIKDMEQRYATTEEAVK